MCMRDEPILASKQIGDILARVRPSGPSTSTTISTRTSTSTSTSTSTTATSTTTTTTTHRTRVRTRSMLFCCLSTACACRVPACTTIHILVTFLLFFDAEIPPCSLCYSRSVVFWAIFTCVSSPACDCPRRIVKMPPMGFKNGKVVFGHDGTNSALRRVGVKGYAEMIKGAATGWS